MMLRVLPLTVLVFGCANAASLPQEEDVKNAPAAVALSLDTKSNDLQTDASSYNHRSYSDYNPYPGNNNYGVTGYGYLDDRYNYGSHDNSLGYGNGYSGYNGGYQGSTGYGAGGGYSGYNKGYNSGGYGGYNSAGYGGYNSAGYGGYNSAGNGGYGGYGGNGGLNSYYGYNNPYYQGANHLGYGYYGKRTGYGNIYNNAIAPSLVTGYRGYTRR